MSIEIELQKYKNEPEKTVKVFSRNFFTWIQIGTTVFTPYGASQEHDEKDVEEYFRSISLEGELKHFKITIYHYDTYVILDAEYFDLWLNRWGAVLHMEDKNPQNASVQNFKISEHDALLLLNYIFARAEKITIDLS